MLRIEAVYHGLFNMKKKGFTFIELLFAVFIGSILILFVTASFITFNHEVGKIYAILSLNDRERFLDFYFRHQVRLAGFVGCRLWDKFFIINGNNNVAGMPFSRQFKLKILTSDNWSEYLPDNLNLHPIAGSQIVVEQFLDAETFLPSSITANSFVLSERLHVKRGDYLGIANCRGLFICRVTSIKHFNAIGQQQVSCAYTIPKNLQSYAEVGKLHRLIFVLQKTKRNNIKHHSIISLYQIDLNGQKEALVDGVQQMQFNLFKNHLQIKLHLQSNNPIIKRRDNIDVPLVEF